MSQSANEQGLGLTQEALKKYRQNVIIEKCKGGRTINELATELRTSYWVTQKICKELERQGKIITSPWPRDGGKVYITYLDSPDKPEMIIRFDKTGLTLKDIVHYWSQPVNNTLIHSHRLTELLSHLYIRALRQKEGFSIEPPPQYARAELVKIRDYFRAVTEVVEQLLLRDNIWLTDNPEVVLALIGDLEETESMFRLVELATHFENLWASGRTEAARAILAEAETPYDSASDFNELLDED